MAIQAEILNISEKEKEMSRILSSWLVVLGFSRIESTGREADMSWLRRERNYNEVEGFKCVREILFAKEISF